MALTDLHIALIGAGVTGVLMVWGYNVWQDRKHRKTAERIFSGEKADALASDVETAPVPAERRQEPTFAPEPADDEPAPVAAAAAQPQPEPVASPQAPEPAVAEPPAPGSMDEIADCTLRFSAAAPIAAPIVQSIQRSWSGGLAKPLAWMARGGAAGGWLRIAADDEGGYREWAVSLQLVDRRGPVSEAELAAFCAGVEALVHQTGATLETSPDLEELAAQAGALDQFCASVDIQFVLHVVEAAGGTFAGTKLRGLAEAAGLTLEDDGLFHARDATGGEAFSLGNLGAERFDAESLRSLATHGLTFSIDVPRVSDGKAAFEGMLGAARQIAGALGGVLVDAQRAPLSDAMIAAIRAKTIELQQRMRDGGIDPGSPRALRLFS
jgi:FtsZ-interacting cell division protein ZipA